MTFDELRQLIDEITAIPGAAASSEPGGSAISKGPPRGALQRQAQQEEREAASALASIAAERGGIATQRASVGRILSGNEQETRSAEAERAHLAQRVRDLETAAALGVACDGSREAARLGELEQYLAGLADQRTRLGALGATLDEKLRTLDVSAHAQTQRAREARDQVGFFHGPNQYLSCMLQLKDIFLCEVELPLLHQGRRAPAE